MKFYIHKVYIVMAFTAMAAIGLLFIRMKLTKSLFLAFLVWNLFLAYIPLLVSSLITIEKRKILITIPLLCIWLLFLPNAAYVLTDFKHLYYHDNLLLISAIIIGLFAVSGHLAGLYSMYQIHSLIINKKLNSISFKKYVFYRKAGWICILIISFLNGLGIYLGRVIRFNSWDIIHKPLQILECCTAILFNPSQHKTAWLIILGFSTFIFTSYLLLYKLLEKKKE